MKKFILFTLVLLLAGCSAVQSVPPTPQPTAIPPTAQVLVATVLVPVEQTVVVTEVVQPTAAPTQAIPPATPTGAPTQAVAPTASSSSGPFTLDDNLGNGFFKNMTYSADNFSLRCLNKTVTFHVTAANPYIVRVELYYRIADKDSVDISEWKNAGLMLSDRQGNFTMEFSAELIDPDWRRAHTWFDFQFSGSNNLGDRVGNSERFVGLINYTNECP